MAVIGRQNLIILFGLSPNSVQEAAELRRLGNQVQYIRNSKIADQIVLAGKPFNLQQSSDLDAFGRALGLATSRAEALSTAIGAGGKNIRDELGQLAMVWAHAERTHVLPGRMVVSGEHLVGIFWGRDHNGMLGSSHIERLAKVFPLAAGAIEDLHLSACNTAGDIQDWPKIFPNLKTIWAYLRTAPSVSTGAKDHLRMWDRATRGPRRRIDRLVAKDTKRGQNVVVWSRLFGLETGVIDSIDALRARVAAGNSVFDSHFSGNQITTDHHAGPLREYYDAIQSLLQHDDLPADERHHLTRRSAVTIRLIYFDHVRVSFATTHATAIRTGCAALGLLAPDFRALDRKAALAAIDTFLAKLVPTSPDAAVRLRPLLVDGLRDLDPRLIPENWI